MSDDGPRATARGRGRGGFRAIGLKLALTLLLLGALVRIVGWESVLGALAAARGSWLLADWVASLLTFSSMALTLRWVMIKAGLRIGFRRVLMASAISNLYGLVVPGDLLAGVPKWAILSAATGDKVKVASAMVLNRAMLAVPQLVLGAIALAYSNPVPGVPVAPIAAAIALLGAVGIVVALHPRGGHAIASALSAIFGRVPRVVRLLESLQECLRALRALRFADYAQISGLSLLVYACGLATFASATRALGLEVPIRTLIWINLAMLVARLLPLTLSGLGVREGLLMLALSTQNVQPAQALGVGLVMFSNTILSGLIGAGCQIAVALGWVRLSESPSA